MRGSAGKGFRGNKMADLKKLPVGIERFEEIRRDGFYYVDKTGLIKELLEGWGKVNLFTRPRRFGKTLNMSMFKSFFEIGCDKALFDGLAISREHDLCNEYMGKFPVISISLKDIDADDFQTARSMAVKVITQEARRLQFLLNSNRLTEVDKDIFSQLLKKDMGDETLFYSLRELTELLNKHYDKRVIVLIDEYDVPLAKAHEQGYYDEMVQLMRSLFGTALKTNENLYFAVLTGCLRVAKESIFTGLNNFNVYSITDVDFDEHFGFTDSEVREMLHCYGQDKDYDIVKQWYDGYHFGNVDVYCPWDVVCYVKAHRTNGALEPQNYWLNTSGNDVVKHFISCMGEQKKLTKTEMEQLINGEPIQKIIRQELTYKELYSSMDNIWSALFMTGYLTQKGEPNGTAYQLVIPNREIRNIFTEQILTLFKEQVAQDGAMVNAFCEALLQGKPEAVEAAFKAYLDKTISIRDTFAKKPIRENFYHGILLGILSFKAGWTVMSNREAGEGFGDIMIRIDDSDIGIIIEVKYSESEQLEGECKKALNQIQSKQYARAFHQEGICRVIKYGIACRRKNCRVLLETEMQ